MTIITQEKEFINFDMLKRIAAFEGEIESKVYYAILGFDTLTSYDNDNETDTVQLGIYNSEDECLAVYERLAAAIRADHRVFTMPEPAVDEKS